jgi:hypothetical protein
VGETVPFRRVFEVQTPPFFFPPKARSKDHSDSN